VVQESENLVDGRAWQGTSSVKIWAKNILRMKR
jgi:hypothetical protein